MSDEKVYARYKLTDSWSELPKLTADSSTITATDNGIVGSYSGTTVTIKPDATKADWLKVTSSGETNYYRRAGAKTASFKGTLKKDGSLLTRDASPRALAPAVNVSLLIQNVLNAQDKQTVTTNNNTGAFAATNVIPGDSYAVTDSSSGVSVTVTPLRRDEDIGVMSVSGKDQNFKAEYDFSPTPLDYGYFSAKFMVAGYQFTPIDGSAYDLYYDVMFRIRNTGKGTASDFDYALTPSSGLDFRSDSAALSGHVAGPIAAGAAYTLDLHLRRPSAVDSSVDVAIETIAVTVTDSSGYVWMDRIELAFWRKLVYFEIFRFQSGPMLGEIASPENDASGAWLSPEGDPVEWYYLPYRREGYKIGIYPASETQGQTKYSIGFDASVLAGVLDKFNALTADSHEPNESAGAAASLPYGQVAMGIVGPGDADFYVTGPQLQADVDTTPPAKIDTQSLAAEPGDRSVTLSWTEPTDGDYWYLDITGSPGDLWQGPRKGDTSAVFRELTNGTEYTFMARSVDYDGNESEAVQIKAIPAWTKGGARSYSLTGSIVSIAEPP
ncbi:MAG: fibronectin type III domain-containing protein, partial [Spirochaetaceae bacterium]|nr:fibronectin type III domain-containing protein [Spirochaetaceae bacterium]